MQDQEELSILEYKNIHALAASKETAESLYKKESFLSITLDSIADAVISTDRDGNILSINRVAQKLTGWTLEEARGRPLCEVFVIVNAESGELVICPYDAVMISGNSMKLAPNTALLSRSGVRYLIDDSAGPIQDRAKSPPAGIVLVFRDVTEKCKLEIELQQTRKLETIGRLAGGIAHDFNNMLTGIMAYSEMLATELKNNPRLKQYAQSILKTTERAAQLSSQLLAFSRKAKRASLPVNMRDRINSAITLLSSTTDKRISIVSKFADSSSMVLGDPMLLESALLNLGLNARDASTDGGIINFESKSMLLDQAVIDNEGLAIAPGEYVEICVSDTGCGMSSEVKAHLFEPFFTTKEFGHGTGLGLASVYGTVKEHNGEISVKSSPGNGALFKLYLPLCKLSMTEIVEEENLVYVGSGCLLVVDDEPLIREGAYTMLSAIGYEVLLAKNGAEAISIYNREHARIRVVILDVVMPIVSGPDTFFALKNINPEVKVLFLSGYTFDHGGQDLLDSGVSGFIQKPFRRNVLYKTIQDCLLKVVDSPSTFTPPENKQDEFLHAGRVHL